MKIMMVVMRDDPPELEDDLDEGKVYSKLFKDFVSKCLAKDKADRPSAEQLLSHKFFKVGGVMVMVCDGRVCAGWVC